MAAEKLVGTVKWFSGQRGFGFVWPDGGGDDLFVHQTAIQSDGFRSLREGQRVEFRVESGDEGRRKAVDVVPLARNPGARGGRGGYGRGGRFGVGRRGDGVECYSCGRVGHLARDCYRGGGGWGDGDYRRYGRGGGRAGGLGGHGGGGGGGGGRGCYNCGEEGHFARDCLVERNKLPA